MPHTLAFFLRQMDTPRPFLIPCAIKDSQVLLLGRYNDEKPENLKELQKNFTNLKIRFLTIHRSKGLEADNVIIVNAIRGEKVHRAADALVGRITAAPSGHVRKRRVTRKPTAIIAP